MQIVDLMALRVKKQGRLDFKAVQMTADQITARRAALRQWLMKKSFCESVESIRWMLCASGSWQQAALYWKMRAAMNITCLKVS